MMDTACAISLLDRLIATPSTSRTEDATAAIIFDFLDARGANPERHYNNIWAMAPGYDPSRPTLMLNSHHDTVKPSPAYTIDPFTPLHRDGRIYGLGSNDAGASVVSLIATFLNMRNEPLPYNLMLAITAEEEVSGEHGMRALLAELKSRGIKVDMAIVGEPTGLQPAIGERGLVVLDCEAHGVTGHAARGEGVNALYIAIDDINRLRHLEFERSSALLGPIGIAVTQIEAGRQHNVVPESCRFVVDVRTTDAYTNEETVEIIRRALQSDVKERSTRVHASSLDESHRLVVAARKLGLRPFVSPTTSDMALMYDIDSMKIGPGESSRSHSADEYVLESEIAEAINIYRKLLLAI